MSAEKAAKQLDPTDPLPDPSMPFEGVVYPPLPPGFWWEETDRVFPAIYSEEARSNPPAIRVYDNSESWYNRDGSIPVRDYRRNYPATPQERVDLIAQKLWMGIWEGEE